MDNSIINESNYEQYKLLNEYKIKEFTKCVSGTYYNNKTKNLFKVLGISLGILYCALMMKFWNLYAMNMVDSGFGFLAVLSYSLVGVPIVMGMDKLYEKYNAKLLKKDYPEIDVNISKEELEKELDKYEEMSSVYVDLNTKKCEHLSNYSEKFVEMTTEEKIAFLEKEKEFWNKVLFQEKNENLDDTIEKIKKKI